MENTNQQPLICLQVIDLNTVAKAPTPTITTTTEKHPRGWKTTAYVNGKFYSECSSKDRAYNINAVREDLAEMGYIMPGTPKQLAPTMSAKMVKKSNRKAA